MGVVKPETRRDVRLDVSRDTKGFRVGLRAEMAAASGERGYLGRASIGVGEEIALDGWIAAFDTEGSDAGLYAYEYRASGYGVSRILTGRGIASFARTHGSFGRVLWSVSGGVVARRRHATDTTVTLQLDYAWP